MKCKHSSASEAGSSKATNQDAYLVDDRLGIHLVCDGMGGHRGGETAAQLACNTTLNYLRKHQEAILGFAAGTESKETLVDLVTSAILTANTEIYRMAAAEPSLAGMGTTLAMLLITGNLGIVAHVGSSRVYLYRNDQLTQLTKDHTLSQELIDRGLMTEAKAAKWAYGRVLSRALGPMEAVVVNTLQLDILPGDRFVLATDGITTALTADEIRAALANSSQETAAEQLVRASHAKNHMDHSEDRSENDSDDATVIVADSLSDISADINEEALQQARTWEVLQKTSSLQDMFLFRSLDPRSIMQIVNNSVIMYNDPSDLLFNQGDVEQNIYIILEGDFEVLVNDTVIAKLSRGNHFGEMSWFSQEPRSATVRCCSNSKLLKVSALFLEGFILRSPEAGVLILRELARELSIRLRATNELSIYQAN